MTVVVRSHRFAAQKTAGAALGREARHGALGRLGYLVDVAHVVLSYVQVLVWPTVAVVLLLYYRPVIERLLPGTRIKLTLAGVTIETTLDVLTNSIEEAVGDEGISKEQLSRLEQIGADGRVQFNYDRDYKVLVPMRNAGLIRPIPRGYLTQVKEVELTPLGRLWLKARKEQVSSADHEV